MGSCFYVVEEFKITRGKSLFLDDVNKDGVMYVEAFLSKLGTFGVSSTIAQNIEDAWFNSVEIEVESFSEFFNSHISNKASIDKFSEEELSAIFEIKKVIDSKTDYIERYGYVFLSYF